MTVYFSSGYGGTSVTLKAGTKGSSTKVDMSDALYAGGGGRLTVGFDGYVTTKGKHENIDFAKGRGADVKSLVNGEVISVANDGIGTIAIYVPSADKTVIYPHPDATISQGAKVTKGQKHNVRRRGSPSLGGGKRADISSPRLPPPRTKGVSASHWTSSHSTKRATASTRSSEWRGPMICSPTGSPADVVPTGMLIAGCCVMLKG